MKNKILLTGANGFLGQSILALLKSHGISIRVTDLDATSVVSNVEYRRADITRFESVKPVLENATTVIHAAGLAHIFSPDANSADNFRQINEIGTANVAAAAAAAGVGHLILISSVSVYGDCTQGMCDEKTICNPIDPYALSKYNAELRAIEIAHASGMALTILRLATLYGEEDPGNLARLIKILDSGCFLWIGKGGNRKSLLYKSDAARACLAVAQKPASGINIYNVSAPANTVLDVVNVILFTLGKNALPLSMPVSLTLFLFRCLSIIPNSHTASLYTTLKKWLAEDVYDTRRFEDAYGFQSQTSLKDGLKREVDWYLQNKK